MDINQARTIDVTEVMRIFKSGDIAAQKAFIEKCPPSIFKDATLGMINPCSRLETILTGLNILAASYCEGINCELGITLSKATCLLSQESFDANPTITHLINVGRSAINCVVGFSLWESIKH